AVGESLEVRAQLVSWNGTPVPLAGREVRWAVTNDGTLSDAYTTIDASGVATVTLTVSTVAGTEHVVTAQDALDARIIGHSAVIKTQAGPPATILLVPESEPIAGSEVRIGTILFDRYGNEVKQAGLPVTWTVSRDGQVVHTETQLTDESGVLWLTVSLSTTAGTQYTVEARTAGADGDVVESLRLSTVPDKPVRYEVTLTEPPRVGRSVRVAAQLKDRYGNDVP